VPRHATAPHFRLSFSFVAKLGVRRDSNQIAACDGLRCRQSRLPLAEGAPLCRHGVLHLEAPRLARETSRVPLRLRRNNSDADDVKRSVAGKLS
jgi:hypothetical protein